MTVRKINLYQRKILSQVYIQKRYSNSQYNFSIYNPHWKNYKLSQCIELIYNFNMNICKSNTIEYLLTLKSKVYCLCVSESGSVHVKTGLSGKTDYIDAVSTFWEAKYGRKNLLDIEVNYHWCLTTVRQKEYLGCKWSPLLHTLLVMFLLALHTAWLSIYNFIQMKGTNMYCYWGDKSYWQWINSIIIS